MNANGHSASDILKVLLFSIFFLPLILYWGFDFFCSMGVMTPVDKPKSKPKRQHAPVQHPEQHGIQNDTLDDPYLEPETNQQLIDDVISGLQNVGFKKRDAKLAVLKACEGRVFEDHQTLIEAALNKSNL
jgi:hypothetical protein